MPYIVICGTALVVSALTLLSGFGLGTLLLPAFIIFFPAEIAVAATAIVHLLNNLFKFYLVGKYADRSVVLRFAPPAAVCALLGALLLVKISKISIHYQYSLLNHSLDVTPVKVTIALLMAVFGLFETLRYAELEQKTASDIKYIPVGGALSGLFGGISGHQGALRAAFLIRAGLSKEGFIGTSVVSAIVVDITRIIVYGFSFHSLFLMLPDSHQGIGLELLAAATASAIAGSYAGSRLMKKVTYRKVHSIVGIMLLVIAVLLGFGFI